MRWRTVAFAGLSFLVAAAGLLGAAALALELAYCYVPVATPFNEAPLCGPDIWGMSAVPFALLAISVGLIATWLIGGVATWTRQVWRAHRYRQQLLDLQVHHPVKAVQGVELVVVDHPAPLAFTIGVLRPRIVVSDRVIELLDDTQFEAVLAHEAHHARRRDPATYAAVRAADSALPFMPVVSGWARRTLAHAEIEADEAAIAQVGRRPLVGALQRMLESPSELPDAAIGGIGGMTTERLRVLAGQRLGPAVTRKAIIVSAIGAAVAAIPTIGILIATSRT